MTMQEAIIAEKLRKGASWAVFIGLLALNVILAVNLTAARHQIAKLESSAR